MNTRPRSIDPAGRLDVLAYRLLDRLAQTQCPREWPALDRLAWQLCRDKLGPRRRRRRSKRKKR